MLYSSWYRAIMLSLASAVVASCVSSGNQIDTPNQANGRSAPQAQQQLERATLGVRNLQRRKVTKKKELTEKEISERITARFSESSITSIKVEEGKASVLGEIFDGFESFELTNDSDVFIVDVKGDVVWPFPGNDVSLDNPKPFRSKRAVVVMSGDDASVLAARMY